MALPRGVADPMFMGELALEIGMSVGEMHKRMSAWELTVFWPNFFATRKSEMERAKKDAPDK